MSKFTVEEKKRLENDVDLSESLDYIASLRTLIVTAITISDPVLRALGKNLVKITNKKDIATLGAISNLSVLFGAFESCRRAMVNAVKICDGILLPDEEDKKEEQDKIKGGIIAITSKGNGENN